MPVFLAFPSFGSRAATVAWGAEVGACPPVEASDHPQRDFFARLNVLYDHSRLIGRSDPMESAWAGLLAGNAVCFSENGSGRDEGSLPPAVRTVLEQIREGNWVPAFLGRNRLGSDPEILCLLREIVSGLDQNEMTLDRQMENFLRSTVARIRDSDLVSRLPWDPSFRSLRDLFIEATWKSEPDPAFQAEILDFMYEVLVAQESSLLEDLLLREPDSSVKQDLWSWLWESRSRIREDLKRDLTGEDIIGAVDRLCGETEIPRIAKELGPEKTLDVLTASSRPKAVSLLENFFEKEWSLEEAEEFRLESETLAIFLKLQERSAEDDVKTGWRKRMLAARVNLSARDRELWGGDFLNDLNAALGSLAASEDLPRLLPSLFWDVAFCVQLALQLYAYGEITARVVPTATPPGDREAFERLVTQVFVRAPLEQAISSTVIDLKSLPLSILKNRASIDPDEAETMVRVLVGTFFPKSARTRSKALKFHRNATNSFYEFLSSCVHLTHYLEKVEDLEPLVGPLIDGASPSSWTSLTGLMVELSAHPAKAIQALRVGIAGDVAFSDKIEKIRAAFIEKP
jgi:hypothetical protein